MRLLDQSGRSFKSETGMALRGLAAAWQAGAISKDTMFELFRRGEILPDGRTDQDEAALISAGAGTGVAR